MKQDTQMPPKIIWMAWLQGLENAPKIVKLCHKSWVNLNPDWKVIMIDNENMSDYFDLSTIISPDRTDVAIQKRTNLLRLNLLAKYGGVWTDATCLCSWPLDLWLPHALKSGFFTFRDPAPERIIANWFIASMPDCSLTQAFCREHNQLFSDTIYRFQNDQNGNTIVKKLLKYVRKYNLPTSLFVNPVFRKVVKAYPYFIFHFHFETFLKKNPELNKTFQAMPYLPAFGPQLLKALSKKKVRVDIINDKVSIADPPLHKLDWKRPARFRRKNLPLTEYLDQTSNVSDSRKENFNLSNYPEWHQSLTALSHDGSVKTE